MSSTDVDVSNSALGKLGVDKITTLSDDSRQAKLCKEQYPKTKRKILRSHPWNFAMDRAVIAANPAAPAFGYLYKYALPADCLRVVDFNDGLCEWEVEGKYLLSNDSYCEIRYIKNVGAEYFDDMFAEMLGTALAFDMSNDLNPAKTESLRATMDRELAVTRSIDAQESSPKRFKTTTFVRSRR